MKRLDLIAVLYFIFVLSLAWLLLVICQTMKGTEVLLLLLLVVVVTLVHSMMDNEATEGLSGYYIV